MDAKVTTYLPYICLFSVTVFVVITIIIAFSVYVLRFLQLAR